ncbi:MAG: hypothetical protein ABI134_13645 [Byssovorax sp.]
MHGIRSLALALGGIIGLAGCARGTEAEVETTFTPGAGGAGNGGSGGLGNTGGGGSGNTTSSNATSGAGGTGAGGSPGMSSSSSSSSGTGGDACDYQALNTCPTSDTLSDVDGDQNNDTRTLKGTTSQWFKVLVNEAVSSLVNYPQLSYTATLATPPGMDFDLFEYDGSFSTPSCSGSPKHATGNPESVSDSWKDTIGTEDTRWLTLEVRYISGSMCPSDPWTLTVKGHTIP